MYSFLSALSLIPTLKTKRLILRPLLRSDAADFYEYASDPKVSRHVLWETYTDISQARYYIREMRKQYKKGFPAAFAIVHQKDNKMIGTIGFMWINWEYRSCEVGYSLNRNYWNQGLTTEALHAVLRYAFDTLHMNRVEAQHETDNPASGRVMEKNGMQYEGTLRQRIINKNRFVDTRLYAILKKDFYTLKEDTVHAALQN